jgi:phosphoribosyl-ATP pyrophosphohydrolase
MNIGDVLNQLEKTTESRRNNPLQGSYTNYLFDKGLDKILKKIGEESSEVIIAAKNESKDDLIGEISDLIYHILILMNEREITIEDISKELSKRHEKSANKKPERREIEIF